MQDAPIYKASARNGAEVANSQTSVTHRNGLIGGRTFMKRLGLGGTALVPASALLTGRTVARAAGFGGGLARGTNQIFATPCEFIDPHLPLCSVIRPISTEQAGAKATVAAKHIHGCSPAGGPIEDSCKLEPPTRKPVRNRSAIHLKVENPRRRRRVKRVPIRVWQRHFWRKPIITVTPQLTRHSNRIQIVCNKPI